ncbi:hypothetical protein GeomeDRAFT_0172 [Geobacter metallireducens RCH3]|uniref:Outer membrane channel n=2 Tax=Geobacter metallireducens TaxID=28232 RepID=Q39VH6_GEOMG|nr:hypothetical protein Gmet_1514 [Geobacter metallireducens GS-15]EHP89374.1 hypothetical protein GeomeDRAFT_0172 [Geobacter metallireducens RCH3]
MNGYPFRLCMILFVSLFSSPAVAGEFSGYAEAKGFVYPERARGQSPSVDGWGTLFNKWEEKLGEARLTASLRGEWLSTDDQGVRLLDPADRHFRRPPFSVQDFWLRLPLSPEIDLQMGRFQLGWGKTDGYSPADAFLPRDLTDPYADEKLPLWALRLSGQKGDVRYEAVGCPVTTPWRLPVLGSRNAPINGEIPRGVSLREMDSSPPVLGFGAIRLLATFGQWDVGGWVRAGIRPAPILEFRTDQAVETSGGIEIPVERRYAEEEGIGIELSRVVGAWVIRGEVAGLFSRNDHLGNAAIGSLSAEKAFGDGTLLMTLAGNAIDPPVDEILLFDRAILPALITAWTRTEEWGEWKTVWSVGLKHGDGLVKAELSYNITDVWKLTMGGEAPYGSGAGGFGALDAARRLRMAIRRSW